ncbi:MAG: 5-(carboxyamino)imidazole ribonucleotide mutase, partial [bacterium]|nr:5-(carboxyamino)imidazole ribonucleotide mutase [bacterium]
GATNAGILAAQILALNDATLRQKLHDYKRAMEEKVNAADARLQDEL